MNPGDVWCESCCLRQRNGFGKLSGSDLDLMTLIFKLSSQRFEERNVRRVCKVDPETHGQSPLDLDQSTAITKRHLRCFYHVHHPQSRWSTSFGLLTVLDAIDEMQRFGL